MSEANEVDSTALLACPFCGGKAVYFDGSNMKHVECYDCGSSGAFMPTEERAIEAWNKRANGAGESPTPTGAGSTLPAGSAAQAANQEEAHPHRSGDAQRRPNTSREAR